MKGYTPKLLLIAALTFAVSCVLGAQELTDLYSIIISAIIFSAVPVINAYLVTKYMSGWPQRHQLITMLIIATVSFLFYAHIIFLVVLIAIGVDKLVHRKKAGTPTKANEVV